MGKRSMGKVCASFSCAHAVRRESACEPNDSDTFDIFVRETVNVARAEPKAIECTNRIHSFLALI
jgi:hypothetical protein